MAENIEDKLRKYGLEIRYSVADLSKPEGENIVFAPNRKTLLDIVEKNSKIYLKAEDAATGKVGFSRIDSSDAFGGLHEFVLNFEEINGKAYLRARDDNQEGLYDVDGNKFGSRTFDKVERKKTDVIEGDVFLVEYDGKQGFILGDESMFGRENAMHERAELKKIGDEACLWGFDDGKECYYTIEGQETYGGRNQKIQIIKIGDEHCSVATDEEKGQCIFSRENEEIYKGWHHRVGRPRIVPIADGREEFLVDVYDLLDSGEEGAVEGLVLLDREGNKHFGDYHQGFLEGPTIEGVQEGPSKEGRHLIDGETFYAFREFNGKMCFFMYDNMPAFGGFHESLCFPKEDNRLEPIIVQTESGIPVTALKFRDGKKIGYFLSDGTSLFGGQHEEEERSFEYKGMTYILFRDVGKSGFFNPSGKNVFGGYHDRINKFYRISFKNMDLLFLEAVDHVSLLSMRRIKNLFRMPSTYYNLEGEAFDSLDAIHQHYGIPADVKFEELKTTDTVMMYAVRPPESGGLAAILEEAQRERPPAEGGELLPLPEEPASEGNAVSEQGAEVESEQSLPQGEPVSEQSTTDGEGIEAPPDDAEEPVSEQGGEPLPLDGAEQPPEDTEQE